MTEREYAIMEGIRNGASDEYFAARPDAQTIVAILAYEAGFAKAWRILSNMESADKSRLPNLESVKKILAD
ncbi:MAG: hypothetical protein ACYC0M_15370 [Burkholderiales bacterium]